MLTVGNTSSFQNQSDVSKTSCGQSSMAKKIFPTNYMVEKMGNPRSSFPSNFGIWKKLCGNRDLLTTLIQSWLTVITILDMDITTDMEIQLKFND